MKKLFFPLILVALASCVSVSPSNEASFFPSNGKNLTADVFQVQADILTYPADDGVTAFENTTIPFHCYRGQGKIVIAAENLKSFSLYVNDSLITIKNLQSTPNREIDISSYTVDGKNTLYLTAPIAIDAQKSSLRIQVPYPAVLQMAAYKKSSAAFALLDEIIKAQIDCGFPGAQLVVIKGGMLQYSKAYGSIASVGEDGSDLQVKEPVTKDTLFDIASNTKIYATTFALQKLVFEEKLSLDDTVESFFTSFQDDKHARITGKSTITINDLLRHQAGFPPGKLYHRRREFKEKQARGMPVRDITRDMILETPLVYEPRTQVRYSDIDFMLLGFIIEKVSGQRLDDYCFEQIYQPLGLTHICFRPLDRGFSEEAIAATEIEGSPRDSSDTRALVHGVVHDEESFFAMDQVSGHAGLFANAESIAVLAQLMLNGGGYGGVQLFDFDTTSRFITPGLLDTSFARGWRRQGASHYRWAFSAFADPNSIGHTGWTGSMTLIDPEQELVVVLLTNAKHTPVISGADGTRVFAGDYYILKRYGELAAFVYAVIQNRPLDYIYRMLIDLTMHKYEAYKSGGEKHNEGMHLSIQGLVNVLKSNARESAVVGNFLESETGKNLLDNVLP